MIDILISSKTRVKLLLKFFLNADTSAYLRSLESEFGESTNAIRLELNRFEKAGLLMSVHQGNRKLFGANRQHPLFADIHNILLKYTGLDQIVDRVVSRLGQLEEVYLVGELGKGLDSPIIDLIFVGDIDKAYLMRLLEKVEVQIKRKIRYVLFNREEFEAEKNTVLRESNLMLWCKN
ncbi:MAG: ArsR family transcriptional regulator [Bacteroidetes bacterium]|nr:ArsR family transcriptional regulator [Bacteroidota bacterium]